MRPYLKWLPLGLAIVVNAAVSVFVTWFVISAVIVGSFTPSTIQPRLNSPLAAAPPTVVATPVPTLPPTPLPTIAPTAPPPPPTATTRPAPTAAPSKPAPPTATPRPARQAVAFSGRFDPRTLRVGQKLVVELTIENKSERPIEGLRVFSRGPWDKYTVVNVVPNGKLESGILGFNIYSGMTVPPGQTRVLSVVAYPNEPGNHEFSFIPNQDTTPLVDEKGEGIVIGGQVNVIR